VFPFTGHRNPEPDVQRDRGRRAAMTNHQPDAGSGPSNQMKQSMNNDIIKGKWKQLSGKIKTKWGKLTENDLTELEGDGEYLAGMIQERYGIAREAAEQQVREFARTL
jgi:uncharacterized protein YjbJ (UPF0337 family)